MDNLETCENKNLDNGPNQLNNVNILETSSVPQRGLISHITKNDEQPSTENSEKGGVMTVYKLIKLTKNKHTAQKAQGIMFTNQEKHGLIINEIKTSPGNNEKEVSLNALKMEYLQNENSTIPSAISSQQCDSNLVGVTETVSLNKNINKLTNSKHTKAIEPDVQTLSHNKMFEMVDINKIMQDSFVGFDEKDNLQPKNIEMPSCSVPSNVYNNKPTSLNTKTKIQTVWKDPLEIVDFNNTPKNTEFVDTSKLPCLVLKNRNTPSTIVSNTIDANMLSSLQSSSTVTSNVINSYTLPNNCFLVLNKDNLHNLSSHSKNLPSTSADQQVTQQTNLNNEQNTTNSAKFRLKNVYLINVPNQTQLVTNQTLNSSVIECPDLLNQPSTSVNSQPVFVQSNDANMTEMNEKKRKVSSPIPYRCLELKKGGHKMDSYGLTYCDRLGFFKAEANRARRCANVLKNHIKIREQVHADLIKKHERFAIARAKIHKHMDDIIEACAKGVENSETDSLANSKDKHNKYSKYKLRELRVLLSRTEVEQYFKQKKLKQKRPRRKRNYAASKVPLLFNQNVIKADNNLPTTLIDENNFETIEQLYNNGNFEGKNIYFINSHKIITAMYMHIFSSFKNCVRSKQVKIINTRVANKLVGKRLKKVNRSKDVNKNKDKHLAFCNFIADFHVLEKRRADDSTIISIEHSYTVNNSITD